MSGINVNFDVVNQKGTPAFYSDIFANRPSYGYPGRVFISTDTGEIYEDTGTSWTLIADAGAGTTGTLQQVTTNGNSTSLPIIVQNMLLSKGAGTGSNNTGLGINALVFNTTGQSNTAIGNSVLLNNSTGNGNVGVGSRALTANTSGGNNVAIGNDSLYINTTGNSNTGIGTAALSLNTSGGGNTAVGNSALNINTTANYNTAVGNSSLSANTTGTNNTAVGSFSLYANTTAGNNTAIGYNSLGTNTTGAGNTSLGYGSLGSNTTGANNTGIGSSALTLNTTGSNNTTIGNTAGQLITTGSNNTILGNYGGTTTLANNIVLSDGAGNVRLYSNSAGLIGINQAVGTPSAQLDIHTTQTYGLAVNGTGTSNAYLGFANAGTNKWSIGNTYNAGANSFDIVNLTTTNNALSITSANNIGFGTTTPGYTATSRKVVAINGGSAAGQGSILAFMQGGVNKGYVFSIENNMEFWCESGEMVIGNAGLFDISFRTNNTNRLIVKDAGNILIGSSTDDTVNKLQVTGSGKFTGALNIGGEFSISGNASVALNNVSGTFSQQLQFRNTGTNKFQLYLDAATNSFNIFNSLLSNNNFTIKSTGVINLQNVPTSATGLVSGDIYRTANVLNIVP